MKSLNLILFALVLSITSFASVDPIVGPTDVCAGSTTVLTDATASGLWSSSNPSIASIGSFTGVVTGVTAGSVSITYTAGGSYVTRTINILPGGLIPESIVRSLSVGSFTFVDVSGIFGGYHSSNPSVASMNILSDTLHGVSSGTALIYFTMMTTGCTFSFPVVVGSYPVVPFISGNTEICAGSIDTLSNSLPGGVWASSNASVATVNSSGAVSAVSQGIATITYGVGSGWATRQINVDPLPDPIFGPSSVCVNDTILLYSDTHDPVGDIDYGGIFSSNNSSIASVVFDVVPSPGFIKGISSGTAIITYTDLITRCAISTAVIVSSGPTVPAITGISSLCAGDSTIFSDLITGGVWGSRNGYATVFDGFVTGLMPGTDTISYAVTNTCGTTIASEALTINPLPHVGAITGASDVCTVAVIMLDDSTSGGIWDASNVHATVSAGMVIGVTEGTDTINYSIANGCGTATASQIITVNAIPSPGIISGPSTVCAGGDITLANIITGGEWSGSNGNAIIVDSLVTGLTAGVDTISYSVTNLCGTASATKIVSINPLPIAGTITSAASVCVAASAILSDSIAGGIWSAFNGNVTVSGSTITGTTVGTDTVKYTITTTCGTAVATKPVTVNPLPDAGNIVGTTYVCVGSSIIMEDTTGEGLWSSSNMNATIDTGTVTGVLVGIDTISYSVTNGCGTAIATEILAVNPLPTGYSITGGGGYCPGSPGASIGLSGSDSGLSYQLYMGATISGSALIGTGMALDFGLFTTVDTYSVLAVNIATGCENNMLGIDTVTMLAPVAPVVSITASPGTHIGVGVYDTLTANETGGGSTPAYQWVINGTVIPGATSSTYISNAFFDGDSVSCQVTSSADCGTTAANFTTITFSNVGIPMSSLIKAGILIYPNPAQDEITIENAAGSEVRFYNLLGQEVLSGKVISNKEPFTIGSLTTGTYIVHVTGINGEVRNIRLIKG